MSSRKHNILIDALNSILFVMILISGGVLFFVLPKQEVSEAEKRKLSPFPALTNENLISGNYADSIDRYYADNFIFRDTLIELAFLFKENLGKKDEELQVFDFTKEEDSQLNSPLSESGSPTSQYSDSIGTSFRNDSISSDTGFSEIENGDFEFKTINSIVVSRGRAIQSFHGSIQSAKATAAMINEYRKLLGPSMEIYCLAIPVGSDFNLPDSYTDNHHREIDFINELYSNLDKSVIAVRAYENLARHKSEYIQFNTDHHWTGRGAFYAYEAFCQAAGFTPQPLSSFTRCIIPNFLGSLYYRTHSADLRRNPDSVEYFKIPDITRVSIYNPDISNSRSSTLYHERARGGGAYGVFLGGDHPLTQIISTPRNGKRLLVFKDSYGNALSPYMASLFDEVYVVDYRYFEGSILDVINRFKITSILFSHNVYMFNASYTRQRELSFLLKKYNPRPVSKSNADTTVTTHPDPSTVKSGSSRKNNKERDGKKQEESKSDEHLRKPPTKTEVIRHTVLTDESIESISIQYGVTIEQISKWNRITDGRVKEGQQLFICIIKPIQSVSSSPSDTLK